MEFALQYDAEGDSFNDAIKIILLPHKLFFAHFKLIFKHLSVHSKCNESVNNDGPWRIRVAAPELNINGIKGH